MGDPTGKPLILLHGYTDTSRSFQLLIEEHRMLIEEHRTFGL